MRDGNMVAVTKINHGQSDDKSDRYSLNCKPVSLSHSAAFSSSVGLLPLLRLRQLLQIEIDYSRH